jgi:hypothetical protein
VAVFPGTQLGLVGKRPFDAAVTPTCEWFFSVLQNGFFDKLLEYCAQHFLFRFILKSTNTMSDMRQFDTNVPHRVSSHTSKTLQLLVLLNITK